MSMAPLQIYTSALIFTPERSIVREMFKDQFLQGFVMLRELEREWGARLQSSQGPEKPVRALEFSPDGRLHVCSANDTVQLWDDEGMGSVQQVRTLCRSLDSPMSTSSFSPDGTLVACGFEDGSVQIWHVDRMDTVALLPPIDRTAGFRASDNKLVAMRDIAFSTNNKMLATLTWAEELRLWDLTGNVPRMLSHALTDLTGSVGFLDYDSYIIWSTNHGLKACSIREDGQCSPDTTSITSTTISTSLDQVVYSRYSKRMVCSDWKDHSDPPFKQTIEA
ncbi:WD40 repeat domain-containing protein [Aspergillus melleus]|uniref:WD40 repeat domain-containing protein n=1 Tax=Aspergillus melleus TaxID=138277 RepID=UPI001E8E58F2|nr:uncharacterized protein LDX57_006868 [Aspergillus melleus]KAH8429199.1 hypothetical protein LDX57_006868 [Aspergillus melleus]